VPLCKVYIHIQVTATLIKPPWPKSVHCEIVSTIHSIFAKPAALGNPILESVHNRINFVTENRYAWSVTWYWPEFITVVSCKVRGWVVKNVGFKFK